MPVIVEVCTSECPEGVRVVVQIGNGGTADLPAGVHASIYGLQNMQWVFLTSVLTDAPIAPGATSPGFVVNLAPADLGGGKLRLVVDDENGVELIDECHEDNNTLEVDAECVGPE